MLWPSKWVKTCAPNAPASTHVWGFPAIVTQIANVLETGLGWVTTACILPSWRGNSTASPTHNLRKILIVSYIDFLLLGGVFSGRKTKSSGCQPAAIPRPARPSVRLSITAHSSAIRAGWCKGATQLPERTPIFFVTAAIAAPVTEGLGYGPPKAWKWRSGVQTAQNPALSANRAPSSKS